MPAKAKASKAIAGKAKAAKPAEQPAKKRKQTVLIIDDEVLLSSFPVFSSSFLPSFFLPSSFYCPPLCHALSLRSCSVDRMALSIPTHRRNTRLGLTFLVSAHLHLPRTHAYTRTQTHAHTHMHTPHTHTHTAAPVAAPKKARKTKPYMPKYSHTSPDRHTEGAGT